MIKLKQFVFNPFQENTFLVSDETKQGVIIDAGCYTQDEVDRFNEYIDTERIKIKYLINTHCHIDHILGVASLKSRYKVDFLAHSYELPLLESSFEHAMMFGLSVDEIPVIDQNLNDGGHVEFGNTRLKVIHTPGHTMGGVCFFAEQDKILFTGDTLFKGSIGRTDLQGGNYETIIRSIKNKILPIGDDVILYPGHGESSTIGAEKKHNPFLV